MAENSLKVLIGWKEIAAYLNCSTSTAVRRREDGLPVFHVGGTARAFAADIDRWLEGERLRKLEKLPELEPEPPGIVVKDADLVEAVSRLARDKKGRRYALIPLGIDTSEYARIEDRLQTAEENYRWLVETVPAWIWETDAAGKYKYSNVASLDILGYRPEELVGCKPEEFLLFEEDVPSFTARRQGLFTNKEAIRNLQCRFVHRDTSLKWLEIDAEPVFDAAGEVTGIRGVSHDITERKLAEQMEQEHTRNLSFLSQTAMEFVELPPEADLYDYVGEKLHELAGDAIVGVVSYDDAADKFAYQNVRGLGDEARAVEEALRINLAGLTFPTTKEAKIRLLRGKLERIPGTLSELTGGEIPARAGQRLKKILGIGTIYAMGFTRRGKFFGAAGIIVRAGAKLANRDVIEAFIHQASVALQRKEAEEALRESEEKYRSLAGNIPVGIFRAAADPNGQILSANPAFARMFGLEEAEEALDEHIVDYYADPAAGAEFIGTITAKEAVHDYEARLKRKDGTEFWASISARGVPGANGKVEYFDGVLEDVTERKAAEAKIQEQNVFLRLVLDSLTHPFLVIDADDYQVSLTNAVTDGYGFKEGVKCYELSHNRERPCTGKKEPCPLQEARRTRRPVTVEHVHYDKEGAPRFVEIHAYPIFDESGDVARVIEYNLDVTERKHAEQALRESEEKSRNLAEESPNMIFINVKGKVVYANKKCEELLGYKREEFYSPDFDFMSLIAPEHTKLIKRVFSAHKKGEEVAPYEYSLLSKSGERLEVIITTKLIEYGRERAILGIVTDVTERKRAQKALEESEEKFRTVVERANDGIAIVKDGRFVYINPRIVEASGYAAEELLDQPFTTVIDAEEIPKVTKYYKKRVKGVEVPTVYETVIRRKDGSRLYVEANAGTIQYKGETAVLAVIRDLTERKKAAEALRESEEKYGNLFHSSNDAIFIHDVRGRIIDSNKQASDLLGYAPEEIASLKIPDLHPPEAARTSRKALRQIKKEGFIRFEIDFKRNDGTVFPAEVSSSLFEIGGNEVIQEIVRDITERRRTEQALIRANEEWRRTFDAVPDLVALVDDQYRILRVNRATARRAGLTPKGCVGRNCYTLFHGTETPPAFCPHTELLRDGAEHEAEFYEAHLDAHLVVTTSPVHDAEGHLAGSVHVARDVTERKQAEETLRESEEKYGNLFHRSNDAIFIHDMRGHIIDSNKQASDLLGYAPQEIASLKTLDLHPPEAARTSRKALRQIKKEGFIRFEIDFKRKEGTVFPAEVSSSLFEIGGNEVIQGIVRDITERQRHEQALIRANEEWRRTFDAVPDLVALVDDQYRILRVNRATARRAGLTPKECVGRNCYTLFHGTEDPPAFCPHTELLRDGAEHEAEFYEAHLDAHLVVTTSPVHDAEGYLAGSVHVARDITERKQAEEALRESEDKFRLLFEQAPLPYQSLNKEGIVVEVNPAWLELLGYATNDVIGKPFRDFLTPASRKLFKTCFPQFKASGETHGVEFEMIRKDGTRVVALIDGRVGYDEKGRFKQTHCILREVSEI